MSDLKLLGKRAAQDYIESNKPLNESIVKIASENNLNPNQIARVVEEANLVTYQTLFEKNADKTFRFPLADTKKIMSSMNSSKSEETVKSAFEIVTEYNNYNVSKYSKSADKVSLLEVAGIDSEKLANEFHSRSAEEADYNTIKSANSILETDKIINKLKIEKLAEDISDIIKASIMEGNDFKDILRAIDYKVGDDEKVATILIDVVGKIKSDEYISAKLASDRIHYKVNPCDKGTIVNPDHPLCKKIDSLKSEVKDFYKNEDKQMLLNEVSTNVRMNERLRATLSADGDPSKAKVVYYQKGPDITELNKTASEKFKTIKEAGVVETVLGPGLTMYDIGSQMAENIEKVTSRNPGKFRDIGLGKMKAVARAFK